jgi:hypothetical protein
MMSVPLVRGTMVPVTVLQIVPSWVVPVLVVAHPVLVSVAYVSEKLSIIFLILTAGQLHEP